MLCCTACEDSQSIASGSSNGSVHVWRVEYVTRTGGMPDKYTNIESTIAFPLPCSANWCRLAACIVCTRWLRIIES